MLLDGSRTIDFSDYLGKVVMVVNTATYWGLTAPSYTLLNALQSQFIDDLVILGFPCNQFSLVRIFDTFLSKAIAPNSKAKSVK